jgi:hypothetical protein
MHPEVTLSRVCNLLIWCLLAGMFIESTVVAAETSRTFQRAIVLSAQKYEPDSSHYGKRVDAPTPVTEYDYDISIRLKCSIYVGRYLSAIDYLPGAFAANQTIEVSFEKHVMLARVPGNGDIKMGIVRRYAVSGKSCEASR